MAALGVKAPDLEPEVTAHIAQIIAMIERLIEAGHAYAAEGHALFSVASFDEYGKLSRRDPEELLAGARVDVAPYKRNPGDFVLWKPSTDDLPGWDSPWGRGRPGWHIECSAMAAAHLGETIDIHAGGIDLQFPHHENEIAQSECAHGGKVFARYWLHNGMLNFGGAKMAKSVGNIERVNDLVREHPPEALRLALLSAHYRQPLEWSDALIEQSVRTLDRLYGTLRDLADVGGRDGGHPGLDRGSPRRRPQHAGSIRRAFAPGRCGARRGDAGGQARGSTDANGREPWLAQEMDILTAIETYRTEPQDAWKRIKVRLKSKKQLAVLIAVAGWRELEAQEKNVPRSRVIKDDAVAEVAMQMPQTQGSSWPVAGAATGHVHVAHRRQPDPRGQGRPGARSRSPCPTPIGAARKVLNRPRPRLKF